MTSLNRQSILFIDDESDTLTRLKYIFKEHFDCHFAETGKSGLELFKKTAPQLVVCDVNLPDTSGFKICRELKSSSPELCLILLSAYNDKELRLEGLEAFADSYIDKSLSDKEIFLRIRNLHPSKPKQPDLATLNENTNIERKINHAFSIAYASTCSSNKTVTLENIASQLALSTRNLQRKLKEETGFSFTQHHLIYRLNESKLRLQQGYSSTDISEILGFSSPSHFSSCFKKKFSMTPSAYLHKYKADN